MTTTDPSSRIERRSFLQTGLVATGAAALLGSAARADEGPKPSEAGKPAAQPGAGIPTRPFGKTGLTLPILGMGGSAMVRLFSFAYGVGLLPLEERVAMVRHAYDSGIRYFDTARVYGESESIVGKGLKGVRDQVYVATKVHTPDPARVRKSVETSLEQLQMDYVDCVQIHSPAIERLGAEGAMKTHAELVKLRDEKMLRYIGLTTHVAFEDVLTMIGTGGFDQVLLAYGYFRKGMDTLLSNQKIEYREMCLAKAHEMGMAIVAMKVMGANIFSHNAKKLVPDFGDERMAQLPPAAIRWVFQDPRVSLLNIGASMPRDIDQNLATLRGNLELTNEDRRLLADFAAQAYQAEAIKKLAVS
jgi:aryl-alcohol dehydrogenase-like predicted oxidoreductase